MGLRIQNNVEAFNAHRQLTATSRPRRRSRWRSSPRGYRINRAADDAAGLAISEKMRGQIGGLAQAQRNAQDGISLVQTAEGALNEVHSMLQRVRDLQVQFANGTLSSDDQDAITAEVAQLGERDRATSPTRPKFNGIALLERHRRSRSRSAPTTGETIGHDAASTCRPAPAARPTRRRRCRRAPTALGRGRRPDARPRSTTAIKNVSTARADFGAVQNRLEHRLTNLATYQENLIASESRIRDVDMASEMVELHEAPDPAAGRHEHARAGQPGPAGRALAPARLIQRSFPVDRAGGLRAARRR